MISRSVVTNTSDTPQDSKELMEKAFSDVSIVHSKYSCLQKKSVNLSSKELKWIRCPGTRKDCFNRQTEKTGYFWLLYQEGVGMFCLIYAKSTGSIYKTSQVNLTLKPL